MSFGNDHTLIVTITKQGANDRLPQSGRSPSATIPIAHPEKPDEQLFQTFQPLDMADPEEHPPLTFPQDSQPSRCLSHNVEVKQPSPGLEDDWGDVAVAREQRRRRYEEGGGNHVPPLVENSPAMQAVGRSRLWGLWADSVRLQRNIEFVRNAAEFSLMETRVERFF